MSLSGYVAPGRALPGAVVTWLVTGSGSPGSWRRGRVRAVPARDPAADGLVDRAQHAALLLPARAPDQRSGAGRRTVRHLPTGPFGPRCPAWSPRRTLRSEEHTSELQSPCNLVCRLLLDKKK